MVKKRWVFFQEQYFRSNMEIQLLLLQTYVLMFLWFLSCSSAIASPPSLAKPHCKPHCGDIEIPYPFGIGPGCYRNKTQSDRGFQILCDYSTNPPKPFLDLSDSFQPEVLEISLAGTLKINSPITFLDCPNKPNYSQTPYLPDLEKTPFYISMKNKFTSVSCGIIASLTFAEGADQPMAVCLSICDQYSAGEMVNNSCGGINCCQASLHGTTYRALNISFAQLPVNGIGSELAAGRQCKYAFLVDQDWFTSSSTNTTSAIAEMNGVPLVLEWLFFPDENSTEDNVVNRYCESECCIQCSCSKGYQGNPYFRGGCQDINECQDPTRPNICGHSSICINNDGGYDCYTPPIPPIKLGIITRFLFSRERNSNFSLKPAAPTPSLPLPLTEVRSRSLDLDFRPQRRGRHWFPFPCLDRGRFPSGFPALSPNQSQIPALHISPSNLSLPLLFPPLLFYPSLLSPMFLSLPRSSPKLQSFSFKRFLSRSALVFIDLSLDLSGHVSACGADRHSPYFLVLLSFGSDDVTVTEELLSLRSVTVLSDFSLAHSGLFFVVEADSPHLHFPFYFSLVTMMSSIIFLLDGCQAVVEDPFIGHEIGFEGVFCVLGDLCSWILHIAAKGITSSPDSSTSVSLDLLAVVSSLLEGLALGCSLFGCVCWRCGVFLSVVVVIVAQLMGFVSVFA